MLAALAGVLLAFPSDHATAQETAKYDPSDLWFRAYTLLQEGIKHEEQGKWLDALSRFNECKPLFDGLAREYPEFYPQLVEYRRVQLVEKLASLRGQMRSGAQPGQPAPPAEVPAIPEDFADGAVPLPRWEDNAVPPATGAGPLGLAGPSAVVRPPADPSPDPIPGPAYPAVPSDWESRPVPPADLASPLAPDESPFARIQRDFDRMRAEIERLSQQNRALESDLGRRRAELEDVQAQFAGSERRAADLQQRLRQLEAGAGNADPDYEGEVARLKGILADALDELERANQEKQGLLAQLSASQSELERVSREREEIERERDSLKAIMDGGGESAVIAQLMEDNRGLRDKLREVEEAARLLEKESGDKSVQIALLREQVDQIKQERQKLLDDNRRYEGHILALRERLKALGQELGEGDLALVAAASPESAAENELLRAVVLKQLRRQSQIMQTKSLLLRELDKLGAETENLYAMVEDMASGPALTEQERDMFRTPEMVSLVEAAGVERIDGVILVEGVESDGSGSGIVETQRLDDALMQLQKAARLDYSEGRYEEAEAAYEKYLSYRPRSVVCLCNLALVKMAKREHAEARELLEKAIAVRGDYGLAYYLLGRNHFEQGEFDDALNRLTESLHHDPENARAHNCVGVISSHRGYLHRAEGSFSEAVKLDPDFADAHFNLAVLYATMEQPDPGRAAEHYERAVYLGVPRDDLIEDYLEAARVSATTVSLR